MSEESNVLPLPKRIDIEPTIRCNFRCPICQRTYWSRKANDMSLDQFRVIIRQFPDLERMKIQGMGEPLLNINLVEMINCAKLVGVKHVSTYTNGSLLNHNDNAKRLVDSGIDLIRISIDTGIGEIFERIRPGSNFNELVKNIESFNSLAQHQNHLQVEFWTVVTRENINQLTSIIDLAKNCTINTVHFQIIMNTFIYKPEIREKLLHYQVNNEELSEKINSVIQYANNVGVELMIQKSKSHSKENPCHWPFDSSYITVEGFVVPCCTIADPSVINMGNVFDEPFTLIWNNPRYQEFRQSISSNNILEPCQNCYTS